MNNKISITTQDTRQILAEALKAIKEAGQEEIDHLKAEKGTIMESINARIRDFENKDQETLTQISNLTKNTNETVAVMARTLEDMKGI